MRRQPFRRAHLIIPIEPTRTVSREFNVVGRVCVNKIFRKKFQLGRIDVAEGPVTNSTLQLREVARVVNRLVSAKWSVELSGAVEATEAVEAGAIQVIKKLCSF